jgi:hypothetical protein
MMSSHRRWNRGPATTSHTPPRTRSKLPNRRTHGRALRCHRRTHQPAMAPVWPCGSIQSQCQRPQGCPRTVTGVRPRHAIRALFDGLRSPGCWRARTFHPLGSRSPTSERGFGVLIAYPRTPLILSPSPGSGVTAPGVGLASVVSWRRAARAGVAADAAPSPYRWCARRRFQLGYRSR